jgi:hypothetical protein
VSESRSRSVRVDPAGHPCVEAFLSNHEDVVTLAEARWLRAQPFEQEPTEAHVRDLWVHLQLVLGLGESAVDPDKVPSRPLPGHPLVERFVQEHAHCVTVAQASRLRRLHFPNDAPVSMELLTGLWALLHYETLIRDRCVQGAEPARELLEHMLQEVVGEAAGLGAAGEG